MFVLADGLERRGLLVDLSIYGARAAELDPPVKAGETVRVKISVEELTIGELEAEVVWQTDEGTGFRFLEPEDPALQRDILNALKRALLLDGRA